jgi:hypothetical protein
MLIGRPAAVRAGLVAVGDGVEVGGADQVAGALSVAHESV